jgi:hypothetical protein
MIDDEDIPEAIANEEANIADTIEDSTKTIQDTLGTIGSTGGS